MLKINNAASRQTVISRIQLAVHAEPVHVKCEIENRRVFEPLQ